MASSRGMSALTRKWGLRLLCLWLTACAASGPEVQAPGGESQGVMAAWEMAEEEGEGCGEEDGCVTLLCSEEACGVYRCEDVEWEPVLLAYKGGIMAPPGSGPRRNWGGRQGKPGDGVPVFIIPWRFHDRREQLASELARLQIRDPIKHHIFPQQGRLAEWFRGKGINIHQHTMVVERVVHGRIHRGSQGGPWYAAWRDFINANEGATQAQVWEQAVKMIFRFELTGPLVPYHWRVRPLSSP
jgi:uncharacterized lipoprotein (TIGR02269 family)